MGPSATLAQLHTAPPNTSSGLEQQGQPLWCTVEERRRTHGRRPCAQNSTRGQRRLPRLYSKKSLWCMLAQKHTLLFAQRNELTSKGLCLCNRSTQRQWLFFVTAARGISQLTEFVMLAASRRRGVSYRPVETPLRTSRTGYYEQ